MSGHNHSTHGHNHSHKSILLELLIYPVFMAAILFLFTYLAKSQGARFAEQSAAATAHTLAGECCVRTQYGECTYWLVPSAAGSSGHTGNVTCQSLVDPLDAQAGVVREILK